MSDAADRNAAARAFQDLQAEVALLRQSVDALSAERTAALDYGPTLESLVERQEDVANALKRVLASPAVRMTAAEYAAELRQLAEQLRSSDKQAVTDAAAALHRAIGGLDHLRRRARSSDDQHRQVIQAAGTGILAGLLLWSVLPGLLARALPERWHVPEWMAARTMAADEAEAGRRLLALARQRSAGDDVSSRAAGQTSDASHSQARQPASPPASRPRAGEGLRPTRTQSGAWSSTVVRIELRSPSFMHMTKASLRMPTQA